MPATETDQVSTHVSIGEAFWTWCRVAALSFGGPAGQIAVMHRILVEEKKWISEDRFLHALNYCMLLPGPEAQQLAVYTGWLMHRTLGGLMAGVLFVVPGFVSILALSVIYASYENSGLLQAVFLGLKPAVMAIVVEAVIRIGKRVLKNGTMVALAAAAFAAIFFFAVPFPVLIVAAGVIGFIGGRLSPQRFYVIKGHGKSNDSGAQPASSDRFVALGRSQPSLLRTIYVSVVCLTLWFGPLIVVWCMLGPVSVYFQEGLFFSKAAVVTFGGAYSFGLYRSAGRRKIRLAATG